MKKVTLICICALAVGAAWGDQVIVGSKDAITRFPYTGC